MPEFMPEGEVPDHNGWRARYDAEMRLAGELYSPLIEAIRRLELPADITQTGGMCLGVSWPTREGGYWLLTDIEGPLPWQPEEVTGWALGLYDQEGDPLDVFSDVEDPSIEAAVALVVQTLTRDPVFPNDTDVSTMRP